MTTLTDAQHQDLINRIFETLKSNPEIGLGEVGECRDEADRIVQEWIEANQIVIE